MHEVMNGLKEILIEIKKQLMELYADQLKKVILYGSYARGEQNKDSDIDLAIVLSGDIRPFKEIDRIVDKIYDIELEFNILFSIHPISEQKFNQGKNPFLFNVKEEGV
jgi:predicted nucleotidyltransferase